MVLLGHCVLLGHGNTRCGGESPVLFVVGVCVSYTKVWHTSVPVYMLFLSVLIPTIYVLPGGFIYAMTGQGVRIYYGPFERDQKLIHNPQITINVLTQIIPAILLPGNPIANMIFKAFAVQTLIEATSFVQDLKLGHYVKVPPRSTFIGASSADHPPSKADLQYVLSTSRGDNYGRHRRGRSEAMAVCPCSRYLCHPSEG